jgi:hypothetical protein
VVVCKLEGRVHGPAFATPEGLLALLVDYDSLFQRYLMQVQGDINLIPEDQEIEACYSTNGTPRKTAVTRHERAGFGEEFINRMSR